MDECYIWKEKKKRKTITIDNFFFFMQINKITKQQ